MNVSKTAPYAIRSRRAELATVKSSVRAALTPVGIGQKIDLVTRVEHSVGVILFSARRLGEPRASGVVAGSPVSLDLRILSRIVLATGGD